ncbi:hypothetical protein V8E53_003882 [Lactarius tabidus]
MDNPSSSDWGVHPKSSISHSSSGRDERIYDQHPSPAPSYTPSPIYLPTASAPSFFPRGILTLDHLTQHPPRFILEHPFLGSIYPGTTIVGQPYFPFSQEVQGQTTSPSLAVGSGTPSGAPIPPGSFCAPPVHLGWSSESLNLHPYDPRHGIMSFVPPGQVVMQPQPVSVSYLGPAGHVQPPGTAAAGVANAHSPSLKPLVLCPVCDIGSRRSQERNRHLLTHLPCWIACSFDACRWRGDRRDNLKKHMWNDHQTIMLDGDGYRLYDTKPLVEGIIKGSMSIEDAEQRAITEVKEMAVVLSKLGVNKPDLVEDPSGRKGKECSQR